MQISWKPMSSAIEMACKHACASAITGSDIFSHGQLNEASKMIFMVSRSGGFHSELSTTWSPRNTTPSVAISVQ
ncbi:hypothetical protein ES332_A05G405300v1 [Gossypium tomentosum]|uniref:Uncharacterized protein n=1 Tax=Gossypium tomentosum TaxID=34277 RepID=A0A5D2QR31_GOSTO|nr:hypothetical protein ES332_A05G405300v1 [Gossypium tomentosum]